MQNKYIIHILIANLLWSFIPVIVLGLFKEISLVMIIFLRFFCAGIILLLISLVLVALNNRNPQNEKISFKQLLKMLGSKNKAFFNLRRILYLMILGFFGIVLQIIVYFLCLKTTSIGFTMIGFQLGIVAVAFYEHGVKSEKLDVFKVLYLIILLFCIGIIVFVKLSGPAQISNEITLLSVFYLIFYTLCLTFLQIGIGKDVYNKEEMILINKNKNYKIIRLFFKLSLIFLTGIALMFPFILVVYFLIPIKTDLSNEIGLFFTEFPVIFSILFRWEILFLIFFSTIITYVLIFIANVKWSSYNLSYSQWNTILTIIEPIGGILFGVILLGEFFPLEYLIIVIFLLALSILLRYAHESRNLVNSVLLISHKPGILEPLALKLLKLEGVYSVEALIGTFDFLLKIKTNSIKGLYYLKNIGIKNIEGIEDVKVLFIDKIYKIID